MINIYPPKVEKLNHFNLAITVEEKDILELEKWYWNLKGSSPTGKLDPDTLVPLISPPLPPMLAKGVFNAFDENRDNHIDFKVC